MFRLSLVAALLAGSAEAFAPAPLPLAGATRRATTASAASSLSMQRLGSVGTQQTAVLTKELFTKLDADGSGTIDMQELSEVIPGSKAEVEALMRRADLNGDGVMDYAEYERLMAMSRNDDAQGGNLYVRNALNLGLLKKGSVLEDCVMVGNKGFDPLNTATSMRVLEQYREAELKHGRLAMLAAVGWPVSELLEPYIAKALGSADLLAAGAKAPSILNGGLDRINPVFFMGVIIFTATVESVALSTPRSGTPGDLGFDPLRLYAGKTADVKRDLELKELNNGRLAMLAITYFALAEALSGSPIV